MRFIAAVVIMIVLGLCGLAAFAWSGLYDIGADKPHTRPVYAFMQTLRERSVEEHARDIATPRLDDEAMILAGAGHYAAMCTGCHLAPGMQDSEIRPGLYPQPPNLSQARVDPREAFWVIKHGIKMSAMPAWGASHDDATIWSMVAFVQKLPGMTPADYKAITAKAPPDEDMPMGEGAGQHEHSHEQGDAAAPESGDTHPGGG